MILYNVTINIEEAEHDQWLSWMQNTHLPDVLATGRFYEATMFRLITRSEGETGITYSVQYRCKDLEAYQDYKENYAPALQAETQKLFGGKFTAFRTLMESV